MTNLLSKFVKRRYYWSIEKESDVLTILTAITDIRKKYVNRNITIGRCLEREEIYQWFVHFDATDNDWYDITTELRAKGYLMVIKDEPNRVYLIKRTEL